MRDGLDLLDAIVVSHSQRRQLARQLAADEARARQPLGGLFALGEIVDPEPWSLAALTEGKVYVNHKSRATDEAAYHDGSETVQ